MNTVHRLQDHSQNRDDHPDHNERVIKVVQFATVGTGKHQSMHALAEGAAFVGNAECFVSWN